MIGPPVKASIPFFTPGGKVTDALACSPLFDALLLKVASGCYGVEEIRALDVSFPLHCKYRPSCRLLLPMIW